MDIEYAIKLAGSGLTTIVSAFALWKKIWSHRPKEQRSTERLLQTGMRDFAKDKNVLIFLYKLQRESYFEKLMGVYIRNEEITPLMRYYADGKVKIQEISAMWRYRRLSKDGLSFELDEYGRSSLWFSRIAAPICTISFVVAFYYALYVELLDKRILFFSIALLLIFMAILSIYIGRNEETVLTVAKRKKLATSPEPTAGIGRGSA